MALTDWLPPVLSKRFNLGQYPQFLNDYYAQFGYAGSLYPLGLTQSALSWSKTEEITSTLPNYITALRRSPPAFAAQLVRASVLSMARFTFRSRPNTSTPRRLFGTNDLLPLEKPFTNMSTGELIGRMEWSAGLAGNAYVLRQRNFNASGSDSPYLLRVLRPDWTAIVYGSQAEPDDPKGALDAEVVGYAYRNGGFTQQNKADMTVLLPEQIAHWSPLVDPMSPGLGMSWITPALRDIQADTSALEHKIAYFSNGATPNLVIKGLPAATTAQFKELVDQMELSHKGSVNAFKTLYLTAGADATVVGSNLAELDLSSITSHGEVRISFLSRVPAVILGISAGLKGSSLNAGNYSEARRNFADSWVYPTLANLCSALSVLVNVPGGSELWFDVADIPLLREDAKDAAEIEEIKEKTIVAYVSAGFKPESVIAAVRGQDISQLEHDDRFTSVQLQVLANATNPPPRPPASPNGQANGEESQQLAPTNGNGPPQRAQYARQDAELSPLQLPMSFAINLPERMVVIENHVQPAGVSVPVSVHPAEVRIEQPISIAAAEPAHVTNQFASPEVRVEAPISVASPDIHVENRFDVPAPTITVEAPNITVLPPPSPAEESAGVEVVYDEDGRVAGTRPRARRRR